VIFVTLAFVIFAKVNFSRLSSPLAPPRPTYFLEITTVRALSAKGFVGYSASLSLSITSFIKQQSLAEYFNAAYSLTVMGRHKCGLYTVFHKKNYHFHYVLYLFTVDSGENLEQNWR